MGNMKYALEGYHPEISKKKKEKKVENEKKVTPKPKLTKKFIGPTDTNIK